VHTFHRLLSSSVTVLLNGKPLASGKLKYPALTEVHR